MPSEPKNRIARQPAVVFTASADKISDVQIAELKQKYGLDLRIRSHVAAIDGALASINEASGYDRTHPGYDRSYDKSADFRPQEREAEVVNPVIANKQVR